MINKLADKTIRVLGLLSEHGYLVPLTGVLVANANRKTLVDLINAYRAKRKMSGRMYLPNLSTWLNHPEEAPWTFLPELTDSLGLDSLGFDESIWKFSESEIVKLIKDAIDGGVIARILRHNLNPTLFKVLSTTRVQKGINFSDSPFQIPKFHLCSEITVVSGDILRTRGVMPFNGFLRVVACENGEFIGLNDFLKISCDMIKSGQHMFGDIPTSAQVARTFIFAFASSEPCFIGWPVRHERKSRLSNGSFLQLVDSVFSARCDELSCSVQSFVTTMPPPHQNHQ
jgi:hypothetical protein